MKNYETDVLVVGGGGAATAATISAHEGGARTMLAVKGQFGVPGKRGSGATSNPLGDFWTIRTVGPKGSFFNPPELVYADMIQAGLGMADPAICRVFVDEVSHALERLSEMGMQFKSKMLATMPADAKAGGTHGIVAIQKAIISATNTQVVEHANLTDLIVQNNRCLGAFGVDDEGEPFLIQAGAVILATGGVGQLFKHSFNPSGNTGDGYAMALRAGATLFNMEFMQQGLATTFPNQAMVMLYEMDEPYHLTNIAGKAFLADYLPAGVTCEDVSKLKANHWPVSCRDDAIHLDRAIKGEILAGRGTETDGVYIDLSKGDRGFEPELFPKFMLAKGIDIRNELVQVQNHHHTSNGGIRIDANGNTSIEGLFAVGEVGGWQGADRLGGTMLGGSQVFGWRAGTQAASIASTRPNISLKEEDVQDKHQLLEQVKSSSGKETPDDLRPALQQVMWENLLVEKSEQSLNQARVFILSQRSNLFKSMYIAKPTDTAIAFEHINLLDVAEAIVEAASMRKESRGSHYRSDFPQIDNDNWLTNIFIYRKDNKLQLKKEWVAESGGWQDQPGDIRIKPWG